MVRAIALSIALAAAPLAAGAETVQLNVVQESLELRPGDIGSAEPVLRDGQWGIMIRLAPGAGAMFGAITGRNIRKRMQVVVDDRILSAPIIMEAITEGTIMIHGNMTRETATALAAKIRR